MAKVQRPNVLIKVEGSASAFKGSYLMKGRECGIIVNTDNRSLIIIIYKSSFLLFAKTFQTSVIYTGEDRAQYY
jgi:hypothetical protein